jgi:hypothetical protein
MDIIGICAFDTRIQAQLIYHNKVLGKPTDFSGNFYDFSEYIQACQAVAKALYSKLSHPIFNDPKFTFLYRWTQEGKKFFDGIKVLKSRNKKINKLKKISEIPAKVIEEKRKAKRESQKVGKFFKKIF